MAKSNFHDEPFDTGTLRKLEIFELYIQEWIPVFLSPPEPKFSEVHIFDFFCGPGADQNGKYGSPLRILDQLRRYHRKRLQSWNKVRIQVHFSDADPKKIATLESTLATGKWEIENVEVEVNERYFDVALTENLAILKNNQAAKLLIIDQCGVDAVSDEVFRQLLGFPNTDFIFFLSSSTLHRFRSLPVIKQKIPNPEDSYHVHRAAFDYYKGLIPAQNDFFLGQFSIRKRSNIYGLIFGSGHPLGICKFLNVCWKSDQFRGEANFDVDRDNVEADEMVLDLDIMKPKKVQQFEEALKSAFLEERFANEMDIIRYCIEAGLTSKHTASVISALKKSGFLLCDFRTPNVRNWRNPRTVRYLI